MPMKGLKAYNAMFGAGSASALPDDKVQTSRRNMTEARYLKYLEYDELLDKSIDRLYDVKRGILEVINCVEDERLRMILTMRFIKYRKWEDIAEELCCEPRHIYRLRRLALAEAERFIPKK